MGFEARDLGISASIFVGLWFIIICYSFCRGVNWTVVLVGAFRIIAESFQLVFAVGGEPRFKWQISYTLMTTQSQYLLVILIIDEYVRVCEPKLKHSFSRCRWLSHYSLMVIYAVVADLIGIAGVALFYTVDSINEFAELASEGMSGLILQTIGQVWFLVIAVTMACFISVGWFKDKHNARIIFVAACVFMMVRSVYGALQVVVKEVTYFYYTSFDGNSVIRNIVVFDKVLGDAMEWIALAFLVNLNSSRKGDTVEWKNEPEA